MDLRPHIVVVEDEATQRQLLADYLSGQNFRVSAVDGGAALHRLVEREAPALVLLDVHLPGEDGFALARWLREKSGRTGIIMVTSAADTVDRVVGLETGADDYVTKPFEPRELLARIRSVLRRGAPDRGAALGRRIAAILAADVAGYSRLVGDDEEGTLTRLRVLRRELIDPEIAAHRGRVVKVMGDGILIEFASAADAVRCALAVQRGMAVAADEPAERRLRYGLASMSATCWPKAMTSSAMPSTSPRAWKPLPSRAESACRPPPTSRSAASSTSKSTTWASRI